MINLPASRDRRRRCEEHLSQLNLLHDYQLFEACAGSVVESERRGLSIGEHGIWLSVLKLMEQVKTMDYCAHAHYIHILEDDAELGDVFLSWIKAQEHAIEGVDIIFTDMYMGPSVFAKRWDFFERALEASRISWLAASEYTGCTSSWLIPGGRFAHVHAELARAFEQEGSLLPLDNCIRRLFLDGRLNGAITAPFLTSIHLESQLKSTVQSGEAEAVLATRLLGEILRRRLSVLRSDADLEGLIDLLQRLSSPSDLTSLMACLVEEMERRKAFRYKYDPRLLAEPRNPQAHLSNHHPGGVEEAASSAPR